MKTIFFDIETGPLPELELAQMVPTFDPAEVKVGNLKDPEKIAAKRAEAEANHRREFIERAALDPLTGRVLAVGLLSGDAEFRVLGNENEAALLREFWSACQGETSRLNRMVGFNTNSFDLPFLIRRSFKHRVEIPFGIRRGRYWGDEMVDLREDWQLGDRQARGSLDTIARYLGVGQKTGDGADFARLWNEHRTKAVEYLRTDLELTARIAHALRVADFPAQRIQRPEPVNSDRSLAAREQLLSRGSYSMVN
ncbi:MAG TPA: ribonuclease H-like domain-containing protein [Verrucomicrobiae bacterium]|nr:ribonuclease H-like domain-containing protein [Verrucomicrobiae bacterium]